MITPTGRHDTPQWDRLAIREAVINAVVHNNYVYGAPAKVELFSDHLEITSIGTIPDGLSKEDFFNGVSMPRNKELMRVFRDVEMVEALGSGMLRIMHTYSRDNFEFGDNFIRFKAPFIAAENNTSQVAESDQKNIKWSENESENVEKMWRKCGENVEKVIQIIKEKPDVTIKEIATRLGKSNRWAEEQIRKMKEQKIIRRVGPDKGGYWELIKGRK